MDASETGPWSVFRDLSKKANLALVCDVCFQFNTDFRGAVHLARRTGCRQAWKRQQNIFEVIGNGRFEGFG